MVEFNKERSANISVFVDLFRDGLFQIRYKLKRRRVNIGHGKECSILINEDGIDGIFASIEMDDNFNLIFERVREGNPEAFLNSTKVIKTNLRKGDRITIGRHELLFSFIDNIEDDEETNIRLEDTPTVGEEEKKREEISKVIYSEQSVTIYFIKEGKRSKPINITKSLFIIGSKYGDLKIKDQKISEKHASVEKDGKMVYLNDLASESGTFLNRNKILRHELRSGDIFRLGDYNFEVAITPLSGGGQENHFKKQENLRFQINLRQRSKKGILQDEYFSEIKRARVIGLFKWILIILVVFGIVGLSYKFFSSVKNKNKSEEDKKFLKSNTKITLDSTKDEEGGALLKSEIENKKTHLSEQKNQEEESTKEGEKNNIGELIDSYSFDVKYKNVKKNKRIKNGSIKFKEYATSLKDIDISLELPKIGAEISVKKELKDKLTANNKKVAECFVNSKIKSKGREVINLEFRIEKNGSAKNIKVRGSSSINDAFISCAKKTISSIKFMNLSKPIDMSYALTIKKSSTKLEF